MPTDTDPGDGGARRPLAPRLVAAAAALALVGAGTWAWTERDQLRFLVGGEECRATALGESVSFDPDQMNHAGTIVALAVKRDLPARAGSIAVATAIQESKLRNLTYGDRDSVGLFQQRPSQGWGTAEQIQDPVYAANAFYDELVKTDGWQDMRITEIAQVVQRSAYPEAYADHEHEGRTLASALSGHSPAGLICRLEAPTDAGRADRMVEAVQAQTGQSASASGRTVEVTASDERHAWAVGAWAVAQAKARNVTEVTVGDRTWSREGEDPMSWHKSDDPAPTGRVVVTLN